MDFLWFAALVIVLAAAYAWGYDNGQDRQLDADRELELRKYSCDKFYEFQRWKEERKASHDLPDA